MSYERMNQLHTPTDSCPGRLLDAGEQLFAKHGFDGASVREITGLAAANLGAITYHFGSKAGLYEAVIARAQEGMLERLEAAAWGSGTSLDRLEAVVRAHFGYLDERPTLRRLLMQVVLVDQAIPPSALSRLRRVLGLVATLVAQGQTDGQIRAGDPVALTVAVVAQPLMLNLLRDALRAVPQLDLEDPATRGTMMDEAVRFVRAGLSRPRRKETT